MHRMRLLLWSLVLSATGLIPCSADVKTPAVFSDHMVLQAGRLVPVWGKADPGETVTVSIAGTTVKTKADENGRWKVSVGPLKAPGPYELTVRGKNTLKFTDVLAGEVWVCSGQSNMQWPVARAMNAQAEIAKAHFPNIRLFTVKRAVAQKPLEDTEGMWVRCTPETVAGFSAVGYFFGRELHKALGVPVGLIHSSWGGTPAEAWTSRETLEAFPEFTPILERWKRRVENYPKDLERYEQAVARWKKAAARAKAAGKKPPRRPRKPTEPTRHPHWPSGLYNGMIAPIIPYGIAGVIWYQGESNASRAYQYRSLFSTMIHDWRQHWRQGDFPFLFVQLANFMAVEPQPTESAWAELREAQTMALALPRTGMAVAIDIGEAKDIHPKNKQEVGRRLALAAQAIAYGRDITYSGPLYQWSSIEGNKVRLYFKHTDGGLVCKGKELKGFAVAGPDRRFVWAEAKIEGDTVVVWSKEVPEPAAVRYAWANNPVCNLYNKAGLPASPFRTDCWPGMTAKNQ